MFPSSLQKNIRELDRQISLLETECEHMEAEARDSPSGNVNQKSHREMPTQIFNPNSGHPPKMLQLPPMKIRSQNCSCRPMREGCPENDQNSENREKPSNSSEGSEGTQEGCGEQNLPDDKEEETCEGEAKRACKRSVNSREVMESSDDNTRIEANSGRQRNSTETSLEQKIWCEILRQNILSDRRQDRKIKTADDKEQRSVRNHSQPKFSSDEELNKCEQFVGTKSRSEKWVKELERSEPLQGIPAGKRRPRSARTRRNSDEVPYDINITKGIHVMRNEEKEKAEFLMNLNTSIRTLQLLIEELKKKSTRERRNDLLNDMQNTLMKISGIKSLNTLQGSLAVLASLNAKNVKALKDEENVTDLKKALLTVKNFCQELSQEKSVLMDQLNAKINTISNLKNKEKEYLSVISNLKFNLERMREEAEEGRMAKRDLLTVKTKLKEEGKVIEALKRSHGKMQSMVEHYVLENEKLRSEVKMGKLETHKFQALLAGKEAENNKYRQELELFQRQITQQLSLLRSKAAENEVESAMEAISNKTNILQTDVESQISDTTLDKGEPGTTYNLTETSSNRMRQEQSFKDSPVHQEQQKDTEEKEIRRVILSEDSAEELRMQEFKSGLNVVLSNSRNLRSSVNEMLDEMRGKSSEKYWQSPENSSNASQCSSFSENASDCTRKD